MLKVSSEYPSKNMSVAKSIASTLVGAATLSREHSVSDPINITYWRRAGFLI